MRLTFEYIYYMEAIMHIKADFSCVFMLNGIFSEKASPLRYRVNEPLYLTVLPLNAHHLPYTVKILNGKALTNEQLCRSYTLPDGKPLIKLSPRYNYVYSMKGFTQSNASKSPAEAFFHSVKSGNLTAARCSLTEELNSTIDNASLLAFFDEYTDIVETQSGKYYLSDKSGKAMPFKFVMQGELIDDIIQD